METIEKEKALDVVRQMVADGQVSQEVAEKYFPELKESNGERIRQLLIRFVKYDMSDNYSDDFSKEECLAWLERQEENGEKGNEREIPNPEQKPVVIPKFRIGDIIKDTEDGEVFIIRTITKDKYIYTDDSFDWIKGQDKYELVEQKPWSEEDETVLNNLIYALANDRIGNDRDEYINFLKSLRPQNGYNPYKEIVESIAEMCKHYDKASHSGLRDFYDNVKVKCKDAKEYDSLYPHATWKPSDEQMKALDFYIKTYVDTEGCYGSEVLELYEQLKKLKEE